MKGDRQASVKDNEELMAVVFAVLGRVKDQGLEAIAEVGLSPQQAHALFNLGQPLSQRELATCLGYDASNITGIVDRLEERGLLERTIDPSDRRVKHLVLTEQGQAVVDRLWERVVADNPFNSSLTADERAKLRSLLAKVAGDYRSLRPNWPIGPRKDAFV
jgi:DNA-binding MarR family transcriptional regulator